MLLVSKDGRGRRPEGRTRLEPIKSKTLHVALTNGKIVEYRVSVYKSNAFDYGNKYSLNFYNVDTGDYDGYDVRYDTRLKRDLSNFDEYVMNFAREIFASALAVL